MFFSKSEFTTTPYFKFDNRIINLEMLRCQVFYMYILFFGTELNPYKFEFTSCLNNNFIVLTFFKHYKTYLLFILLKSLWNNCIILEDIFRNMTEKSLSFIPSQYTKLKRTFKRKGTTRRVELSSEGARASDWHGMQIHS